MYRAGRHNLLKRRRAGEEVRSEGVAGTPREVERQRGGRPKEARTRERGHSPPSSLLPVHYTNDEGGSDMARKVLTRVGVVVLAVLTGLVVPGFTQPFADVPTKHWAYDAIAELAAKGLIEGYPDGKFKGGQPLTRYEMAMIVARIVARIEAIPTPPPLPPDLVRRAELDPLRRDIESLRRTITTIERLVSEFRAELAALGVRVTALEEELSALKARLDHTRITGDYRFQYTFSPRLAPFLDMNRVRLTIVGTVGPDVSVHLRARWIGQTPLPPIILLPLVVDFDRAHLDWTNAFGVGLNFRVGRQVIDLGPVGLLLNESHYNDHRDGIRADWAVGPVRLMGFAQWENFHNLTTRYLAGGRASFDLIPGFTVGVNVRSDAVGWADHNVPTACTPTIPGIIPPRPQALSGTWASCAGSGIGADLKGELVSGLTLTVEYATYTPTAPPPPFPTPPRGNYLQAMADFDFAKLAGIETLAPKLSVWYKDFDKYVIPGPRGMFATPDDYLGVFVPPFTLNDNLTAFGGKLTLKLLDNLSVFATYEAGSYKTPIPIIGATNYTVFSAGGTWTVAPKVNVTLSYNAYTPKVGPTKVDPPGVVELYTVYVTTSW